MIERKSGRERKIERESESENDRYGEREREREPVVGASEFPARASRQEPSSECGSPVNLLHVEFNFPTLPPFDSVSVAVS